MAAKPKTFLAYLKRRKQDHYSVATVWVFMAIVWVLFPGMIERGDRYSASVKFIVVTGPPMWIGINYIVYRGWLGGPKRTKKK